MLIIRLTRRGRRNDPSFRLVVTEKTNPIRGKFLEELGHLDTVTKAKSFKKERILHWLSQGAKCSPTVNNLLVSEGIIKGQKVKAWRPKRGAEKKEDDKETEKISIATETKQESPEIPEKAAQESKKDAPAQA